jgi:hypothetical protein
MARGALLELRRESLLGCERGRDRKRLLSYGFKAYSQNDEDGIIQEIFRRIGWTARTFIEFGVGTGAENNTLYLLFSGWRGLWIEADADRVSVARTGLSHYVQAGQLSVACEFVVPDNVNSIIDTMEMNGGVDLLSIDIDGNDYWVWKDIAVVKPRVVVIEYNATFRPPVSVVIEYNKDYRWDGTNYFGASLKALEALGRDKGYTLVGCCLAGVNAFFVREDLVQERFCAPFTAENHYEPPRYSLFAGGRDANPPRAGTYRIV